MKILVFGNRFFSINESVAAALAGHGLEVRTADYRDEWYPKNFCRNPVRRRRSVVCFQKIQEFLKRRLVEEKPEVLFAISGNVLLPETLKWVREKGIGLVLVLLDSIHRLPLTQLGLSYYDLVYIFEPTDLAFVSRLNGSVSYLPPAFNPDFYFPISEAEKSYDVTFVGTPYHQRLELLDELCRLALEKGVRVALVGKYWHRGIRRWKFRFNYPSIYRFVLKNGMISPPDVNILYNRSKVVLNHHIDIEGEAVNCRLFDIAGAGAFQLVDYRCGLGELFKIGEEVVTYSSLEDFTEKIKYFLAEPARRDEVARAAHRRAIAEHTYHQRLKKIANDLEKAFASPCRQDFTSSSTASHREAEPDRLPRLTAKRRSPA